VLLRANYFEKSEPYRKLQLTVSTLKIPSS
jgi:hypothetical protein